jgi:hypothetical protein
VLILCVLPAVVCDPMLCCCVLLCVVVSILLLLMCATVRNDASIGVCTVTVLVSVPTVASVIVMIIVHLSVSAVVSVVIVQLSISAVITIVIWSIHFFFHGCKSSHYVIQYFFHSEKCRKSIRIFPENKFLTIQLE